ncbi:MAG: hypothetical protein WCT03_03245 [Candidatus Obscuribacterales bacterium]|jgi:hypothetical protein
MKATGNKRQVVEVDLEVYLLLRKLAEAAEMWDFNQDCCKEADEFHLGLVSTAVEEVISVDRQITGPLVPKGKMWTSIDWIYALPANVRKQLRAIDYDFRHPEFDHEQCSCSEDDEEDDDPDPEM